MKTLHTELLKASLSLFLPNSKDVTLGEFTESWGKLLCRGRRRLFADTDWGWMRKWRESERERERESPTAQLEGGEQMLLKRVIWEITFSLIFCIKKKKKKKKFVLILIFLDLLCQIYFYVVMFMDTFLPNDPNIKKYVYVNLEI